MAENITQYITNVSFYESFFYQTLIELGIFEFFLLSLHFIYLILFLKNNIKYQSDSTKLWIYKVIFILCLDFS